MDEVQSAELVNSRLPRHTYLLTYSQADLTKFPTRKGFGKYIKKNILAVAMGKLKSTIRHVLRRNIKMEEFIIMLPRS